MNTEDGNESPSSSPVSPDLLAAQPLFASLERPALEELAARTTLHQYKRTSTIADTEGDDDRAVVLLTGIVGVGLRPSGTREILFLSVAAGESLLLSAMRDVSAQTVFAVALGRSSVTVELPESDLLPVIEAHPAMQAALRSQLGRYVVRMADIMSDRAHGDMLTAFARLLGRLCILHHTANLDLTHDERLCWPDCIGSK